jgi:hypothetical protein
VSEASAWVEDARRKPTSNVMVWTAPAPASRSIESCAKMVVVEQPSEGAPSMGKSITDLSSVTTVGVDLAKHVFQVHAKPLPVPKTLTTDNSGDYRRRELF